jgi:hypothetical protein
MGGFGFECQRMRLIILRVIETCAVLRYYAPLSNSSIPTFRDNLSVPSSRVKKSKKKAFFLDFLAVYNWTDMLSRNVDAELPLNAA